ncbi:hypothetical protein BX600DRAFT_499881 [Xylariales sp. PMI_506]|nr:hypothetical protein BX600DRAFT_499881 [Xylariales sp. PMI_506]
MYFKSLVISATLLGAACAGDFTPVVRDSLTPREPVPKDVFAEGAGDFFGLDTRASLSASTLLYALNTATTQALDTTQLAGTLNSALDLTNLVLALRSLVTNLLYDVNLLGLGSITQLLSPQLIATLGDILGGLGGILGLRDEDHLDSLDSDSLLDKRRTSLANSQFTAADQSPICSTAITLVQVVNGLVQTLAGSAGLLTGINATVAALIATIGQIVTNLVVTIFQVIPVCGSTADPLDVLAQSLANLLGLLGGIL